MAFDFKKEYKEFYLPGKKPELVTVPPMNYVAVRGKGDPNEPDGEYKKSIGILYALAYTIKMSKMGDHRMEGYFDFVVPPLEGFWWQSEGVPVDTVHRTDQVDEREGSCSFDYTDKSAFEWISAIRLPDFVTEEEFRWAKEEAERKKKLDCSLAEFLPMEEGLCVQMLHTGPYDDEPATVSLMDRFLEEQGYRNDFTGERRHHEIYLSDVRKVAPEKWRTVIRHPIAKI